MNTYKYIHSSKYKQQQIEADENGAPDDCGEEFIELRPA